MKAKELIEYLQRFKEDEEVGMLVVNTKYRKRYPVKHMGAFTDTTYPVMFVEVEKELPLDEETEVEA